MKEQLFRKVMCKDRNPPCSGKYDTDKGKECYDKDRKRWDAEKYFEPYWWLEPVEDVGWINVNDRLPEVFTCDDFPHSISDDVLMDDDKGETAIGNYITYKNDSSPCFSPHGDDVINSHKIVYWMPIPPLPKPTTK